MTEEVTAPRRQHFEYRCDAVNCEAADAYVRRSKAVKHAQLTGHAEFRAKLVA